MSAAGFDRVNVTHSQLSSDREAKSLSSTNTISGNVLSLASGPYAVQNRRTAASPSDLNAGTWIVSTPGITTFGAANPSGSRMSPGTAAGRSRRFEPAAATIS